ncbi:IclR family transcriptional regulator [Pigmentiphaga soli]|uniref:IclR family transcriptional regulator n=1 Tax=Pigmentiphaga soli TaxID=1007095 RepID=A0ABP8H7S4_9BURK
MTADKKRPPRSPPRGGAAAEGTSLAAAPAGGKRTPAPLLRKDAYLQSLEKGLAVLNAFTVDTPELSIADIAERTGQDRASARRAVLTLTHLGYTRQAGKKFSLTPRVLTFGYHYLGALPFWAAAYPVLEALSDELNETVSIGVLDATEVVFVLRVPAKRFLTFDSSIGSRVPAHLHSIGHLLLAALPDDDLDAYLDQVELSPVTPFSITGKAELREQILAARRQGWSLTSRQYEENYCGIAVPLADGAGRAIAALNVSLVVDRDAGRRATEDILPRLRLAAKRIRQPRA